MPADIRRHVRYPGELFGIQTALQATYHMVQPETFYHREDQWQITLWDQRGSEVIRGELLVIPIEESLVYVQPVYLRAEGGTIPELKRVVVAHGNRVVMGETLEEGLAALFGGARVRPSTASQD